MRKHFFYKIVNLPMVFVGVAALCCTRLLPNGIHNIVLIGAWILVIAGAAGYVKSQKD